MPWELQDEQYRCPVCGGLVYWEPDCPGYPGSYRLADGTVRQSTMVCSPPCGNADYFSCKSPTCPWWYREPNTRGNGYKYNLGSDVPMGEKPMWFGVATGWRMSIEEADEEWVEDDTYDTEEREEREEREETSDA